MINVKETDYCKLEVDYVADQQEVKDKIFEMVVSMKDRPVPGFRPGKASNTAIRRRFKKDIDNAVKQLFVSKANDDVLYETKIKPVGETHVQDVKLEGDNFSCKLLYSKRPDFELKPFEYELPPFHAEQTVEDITQVFIQQLREKHANFSPYEDGDFVKKGDRITIAYELSNGHTEDGHFHVVAESDFDTNLYGMKIDEVREFSLPGDDGQEVTAKVTLNMGMKSELAPLDDELAKTCGVNNVELLMQATEALANKEFEKKKQEFFRGQLVLRIVQDYDFQVPEWLINAECQFRANQQGFELASLDQASLESLKKSSSDTLKFTMVLDQIREENPEASISDKEALDNLAQMAAASGIVPDQWLQWAVQSGLAQGLIQSAKNDFALSYVISKSKIAE